MKGDAESEECGFRYPAETQSALWPSLAEQLAVSTAHQRVTGLNQADGAIAQIMSFPGAFGNAFGAE